MASKHLSLTLAPPPPSSHVRIKRDDDQRAQALKSWAHINIRAHEVNWILAFVLEFHSLFYLLLLLLLLTVFTLKRLLNDSLSSCSLSLFLADALLPSRRKNNSLYTGAFEMPARGCNKKALLFTVPLNFLFFETAFPFPVLKKDGSRRNTNLWSSVWSISFKYVCVDRWGTISPKHGEYCMNSKWRLSGKGKRRRFRDWMLEVEMESITQRKPWQWGHWACQNLPPSPPRDISAVTGATEHGRGRRIGRRVNGNVESCPARRPVWEIRLFFSPPFFEMKSFDMAYSWGHRMDVQGLKVMSYMEKTTA